MKKSRSIVNVVWSLIERYGVQSIGVVVTIFMARILSPEDFGLIALVSVLISVSVLIVESGLSQAYIQKQNVSDVDANTIFITNLGIGAFIYICIWLAAEPIAIFYEKPLLTPLCRAMGVIVIFSALRSIQIAKLIKTNNFKLKSTLTITSTALSGCVGLIFALSGMGVWSLVLQQISLAACMSVGLWYYSPWQPRFEFSLHSIKNFYRYGLWIILASLLRLSSDAVYVLLIGRNFVIGELGYYSKATQITRMSADQFAGAIGSVTFPILSGAQNDLQRIKNLMEIYLRYTTFILSLVLSTILVVANPLVSILLTDKWLPMSSYLQLLCLAAFVLPIHAINIYTIQAMGKSQLNFFLSLIKSSLRIFSLAVTYKWGITYILLGEVAVSILSLFVNTHYSGSVLNFSLRSQVSAVGRTFTCAALATLSGFFATSFCPDTISMLIVGSVTVVSSYFACQLLLNRSILSEIVAFRSVIFSTQQGKRT